MDSAIKAAKKLLKKDDSGSLKIKALAKSVAEKIDDATSDQVKDWILASDKFSIEGQVVSLAKSSKKRKSDDADDEDGDADDEKAKKKAAKKAKKEAKKSKSDKSAASPAKTPSSSSDEKLSMPDAKKWRTDHKIVLMSTTDDVEGRKISEALCNDEAFAPYTNFASDRLKTSVHEALLHQCTAVNGFTSPSAIQAQCWPVLLHSGSDGKRRDIVG